MASLFLDSSALRSLASRPEIRAEFPFLAIHAAKPASSCCGGGVAVDAAPALQAIANLPPARKETLKQMAGVDTIKVRIVRAGRARVVRF